LKNKKLIVFLTGTRADFGKLKPLMEKIEKSKKFECFIFITGMHTLSKYGNTWDEVVKEGYKNIFVFMNQTHTTDQDIILANTITGFGNFIKEIKPDMIVVHGDRVETLAGAIVGTFNNILVAHVEGGEVSGTIDESIRHSVTKLSHIHFVSNDKAKNRLIQMGEWEKYCYKIGSPDIEIMNSKKLPSLNKAKKRYGILFDKYAIFIFHPIHTELEELSRQINEIILSLIESKKNFIVIYPNNDNGTNIILESYSKLKNNKKFRIIPSIRFEYFLTFLKNAEFIIGNSSSGIREAEVYGTPTINIGSRQNCRSENKKIINVKPKKKEIIRGILNIHKDKFEKISYFGTNIKSSELFFRIISSKEIWNVSLQKKFIDSDKIPHT
jgi:UDP-N-acetylglucosamine 2-epimerase (hydrolysing)